jgi:hypothetical protein
MISVICLQILTSFWIDGRINSDSYWMYMEALIMLGTQKCIQLSHEFLNLDVRCWNCYWKGKKKTNQLLSIKLRQHWFSAQSSGIHNLADSVWSKEEMTQSSRQWKLFFIVQIHRTSDEIDRSNYTGISMSPATYKIFSNILFSNLIPY